MMRALVTIISHIYNRADKSELSASFHSSDLTYFCSALENLNIYFRIRLILRWNPKNTVPHFFTIS